MAWQNALKAGKMLLWMTLLTGVIYPLLVTLIAQSTMSWQANGSIAYQQGVAVGSYLIGQNFQKQGYFWPRPSATDYKALPGAASNFGWNSAQLQVAVEQRRQRLSRAYSHEGKQLPAPLLFSSASGLDPHLAPYAARFQINRIAKARGLPPEQIEKLLASLVEKPLANVLGEPCLNVLGLNLALDNAFGITVEKK